MLPPKQATRYSVSVSQWSLRDIAPAGSCDACIASKLSETDDLIKEAK